MTTLELIDQRINAATVNGKDDVARELRELKDAILAQPKQDMEFTEYLEAQIEDLETQLNDKDKQCRFWIKTLESRKKQLRDQFAMAALNGMCATFTKTSVLWADIAVGAFGAADAMLAEREKGVGK